MAAGDAGRIYGERCNLIYKCHMEVVPYVK